MVKFTIELKQLKKRQDKIRHTVDKFELKLAKQAYKKGLCGYICLTDGSVEVYYTYRLFKKWYKSYSKSHLVDQVVYKEAFND